MHSERKPTALNQRPEVRSSLPLSKILLYTHVFTSLGTARIGQIHNFKKLLERRRCSRQRADHMQRWVHDAIDCRKSCPSESKLTADCQVHFASTKPTSLCDLCVPIRLPNLDILQLFKSQKHPRDETTLHSNTRGPKKYCATTPVSLCYPETCLWIPWAPRV